MFLLKRYGGIRILWRWIAQQFDVALDGKGLQEMILALNAVVTSPFLEACVS